MSSAATAWAWQQRVGKKKLLLLALADLADDRGCTRTPINTLAEMVDLHQVTVMRQLGDLEAEGLIERLGSRNAHGAQEVSRTRLRMGSAGLSTAKAGLQNVTQSGLQNVTRLSENADGDAISAGLQNVTHKDKKHNSLSTSNNHLLHQQPNPKAQDALRSVAAAGLLELWGRWVQLGKLATVTQESQIVHWQRWIDQGHAEILRQEANYVIEDGSYNHPMAGLKKRIEKAIAVQQAESANSTELSRAYGGPQCQPGEVRQAPDGKKFTVAYVEYGIVFWEETNSPNMIRHDVAAGWPVLEVTS